MNVAPQHDPFDEADAEDEDWSPGPAPSMSSGPYPTAPEETGAGRIADVPDGFDEHDWVSTWASIEDVARDDPDAALSQYVELVEQMLTARGYSLDDPVAREGEEPEVVRTYLASRETAERAEVGDASRGDVELAIDDLRALFDAVAGDLDYS